jgi:carboxylesterase
MTNSQAPAGWLNDFAADGSGANAKTGIVLVHGFTGSPATPYEFLAFQVTVPSGRI